MDVGYKGRLIGGGFSLFIVLMIRTIVVSHFGSAPHNFPLLAILVVMISWFFGREYDKTIYKANRDSLTGLFNRYYVFTNSHKLFTKADRKEHQVAIIFFDVNDFKNINDTYGHDVGDVTLKNIAALLQQHFGKRDIVSRWGGDEFLVIAPFSNRTSVTKTIDQITSAIDNDKEQFSGISMSIGKAIYPKDANTFKHLVSQADADMYRFKPLHY